MLSKLSKSLWTIFTESFGTSFIHPQSLLLRFQRVAVDEAKKHAKGKLIDIGCGRMPYRGELEPLVDSYTGVDHPSVSKLYKSDIKPDILADAKKLPFKDKEFNIALLFQVLEHVDSPREVIKEAARVLKPNGAIVISVPFLYPLHDMPHDWARYTSSALKGMLNESGFEVTKIVEQGGFVEFWLQLLNTFLVKRIYDMVKRMDVLSIILLLPMVLFSVPVIVTNNLLIIAFGFIVKIFPKYPNYFPLQYIVVAKTKN